MMTKTTSRTKALFMQCSIAPLITGIALSFCISSVAQEKGFDSLSHVQIKEHTTEGASPELMKEFADILNKHQKMNSQFKVYGFFPLEERKRLEAIFKLMNREQQSRSVVVFMPPPKPLAKTVPTAKQLEDFSNPKNYGVWINEKKVSNDVLKNYEPSDFSQVFISRLHGAARTSVSYNFQVDLMTNKYYEDYLVKEKNNTSYVMMVQLYDPKESPKPRQ